MLFLSVNVLYKISFFCLCLSPSSVLGYSLYNKTDFIIKDTLKKNETTEAVLINEVINTKNSPNEEKVQYLSELTKYGFKNLFTQFTYNSTLSYSSQVNPNAELYMQDYLTSHKKQLIKMQSWGLPYFNLIDNIFKQYGLPKELKYLAVIESSLQTNATSWVGAAGPWQFMPGTAKNYGLTVNHYNDERRDYFKSTHAAARMLLQLYKDLHDWLLVIAAYNGGAGRVYSAIKKSGSNDFWKLQYYLPQESRNHVKKFIATHYVMETRDLLNSDHSVFYQSNHTIQKKQVLSEIDRKNLFKQTITGKYLSAVIAKNLSIEIPQFNLYNPDFDNKIIQEGKYELILPEEKMKLFLNNKYQILSECIQIILDDNSGPVNESKKIEIKKGKKEI